MSTARKLGLAAALLIVSQLLSRLLGFVRDAFIAAWFGADGHTDAFIAAFTIPDWLNYLVAGGTLSITFIPIYTRYLASGDEAEGNRVFSIVATAMGLVLIGGIIALEIWTPELAHLYLRRMRGEDIELAISLTRILLPAQFCFYLGGLASATLFARQHFRAAAMAPLLYNAGTIAGGLLFGRSLGVASLAWGTLAGAIAGPLLLQMIAAVQAGMRYFPSLRVTHKDFRRFLVSSLPLMIGVSLVTADMWIIRYFAARDVGAISLMDYARKLVLVPIAVAGQAVAQASMPFFARLHAEGKRQELGELVGNSARASSAVASLVGAAMIALAVPLVELVFHRGRFAPASVAPTALYLQLFACAIPLWGMQGLLSRAFYAAGDTLTPMIAGTVIAIASLPIYWIAYRALGPAGLAIASNAGILMHTLSLLLLMPRRLDTVDRAGLMLGVGRALLLGAIAAVPTWAAATFAPPVVRSHTLDAAYRLTVGGLVFVAFTLALMRPLRVQDATALFDKALSRLRRR